MFLFQKFFHCLLHHYYLYNHYISHNFLYNYSTCLLIYFLLNFLIYNIQIYFLIFLYLYFFWNIHNFSIIGSLQSPPNGKNNVLYLFHPNSLYLCSIYKISEILLILLFQVLFLIIYQNCLYCPVFFCIILLQIQSYFYSIFHDMLL